MRTIRFVVFLILVSISFLFLRMMTVEFFVDSSFITITINDLEEVLESEDSVLVFEDIEFFEGFDLSYFLNSFKVALSNNQYFHGIRLQGNPNYKILSFFTDSSHANIIDLAYSYIIEEDTKIDLFVVTLNIT